MSQSLFDDPDSQDDHAVKPLDHSSVSLGSSDYLESLWTEWQKDPNSVDENWQQYFAGINQSYQHLPTTKNKDRGEPSTLNHSKQDAPTTPFDEPSDLTTAKITNFIHAYRSLGHLSAHINPLAQEPPTTPSHLLPEHYGITLDDPKVYLTADFAGRPLTIKGITEKLQRTYTRSVGADYCHLQSPKERQWFQDHMESCENKPTFESEQQKILLKDLCQTEGFEKFLHKRYLGKKRFSCEGIDVLVPMLRFLADDLVQQGTEEICLGMAHRGRLNVLVNFMEKPKEQILKSFEESEYNPFDIDGDVKYHIGYASEVTSISGQKVRIYLAPNPSHLEAIGPVINGFVRARQQILQDDRHRKVIPVILHGDAAFSGQGIVAETLNLSQLKGYSCGGSIHIILNNQVGFTTSPHESRSCHYASDLAKFIESPIIHVNSDDPEACIWAVTLASRYRYAFHKDVFIDVVGYRRHGHNESDEPSFTQPLMYQVIKQHPSSYKLYKEQLTRAAVMTADEILSMEKTWQDLLQKSYLTVKNKQGNQTTHPAPLLAKDLAYALSAPKIPIKDFFQPVKTSISLTQLTKITNHLGTAPSDFHPHPKIMKILKARSNMPQAVNTLLAPHNTKNNKGVFDWATAELLALGSLALEGHPIRLSGQDVQRGTFSSRHGTITDIKTGQVYNFLSELSTKKHIPQVEILNSPLSELGCLGFEFGYAVGAPKALVLWEAQFGDFANGAQIIIDQFITASEAKWQQTASLVLLL
ncbi:MAG: 2-oxoglutarate dehydrogenase E1 component, partial [Proteobacteria bacterium]|nr:2-oxoglutarate dehydrogenase E1 component [Pseudomonadota bacterium]